MSKNKKSTMENQAKSKTMDVKPSKKQKLENKTVEKRYDFSVSAGGTSSKICPFCFKWNTKQYSTKGNIQYRECEEASCPGDPQTKKKTYKVIGVEI